MIQRKLFASVLTTVLVLVSLGFACSTNELRKRAKQIAVGIDEVITISGINCENSTSDVCKLQLMAKTFNETFPTLSNGDRLTLLSDIVSAFRKTILPMLSNPSLRTAIALIDGALRWLAIEFEEQASKSPVARSSGGNAAQRQVIREYLNSPKVEK